jgi:hypothetical protein
MSHPNQGVNRNNLTSIINANVEGKITAALKSLNPNATAKES